MSMPQLLSLLVVGPQERSQAIRDALERRARERRLFGFLTLEAAEDAAEADFRTRDLLLAADDASASKLDRDRQRWGDGRDGVYRVIAPDQIVRMPAIEPFEASINTLLDAISAMLSESS